MGLIRHLSSHVKSQISEIEQDSSDMLEQFYAIFLTRLCDKVLLSKLMSTHLPITIPQQSNIFQQVWAEHEQNLIYQELADSHHIDKELIANYILLASPLVYNNIIHEAQSAGMSVIEFLHGHCDELRSYLPAWVGSVIPIDILINEGVSSPTKSHGAIELPQSQSSTPPSLRSKPMPKLPQPSSKQLSGQSPYQKQLPKSSKTSTFTQNEQPVENFPKQSNDNINQRHTVPPTPTSAMNTQQQTQSQQPSQSSQASFQPENNQDMMATPQASGVNNILKIMLPVLGLSLIAIGGWWFMSSQSQPQQPQVTDTTANTIATTPTDSTITDSTRTDSTMTGTTATESLSSSNAVKEQPEATQPTLSTVNTPPINDHATTDNAGNPIQNNINNTHPDINTENNTQPTNNNEAIVYSFDQNNTPSDANQPNHQSQASNMTASQSYDGSMVYEFSQPEENNPLDELDNLVSTRIIAEPKRNLPAPPPSNNVTEPLLPEAEVHPAIEAHELNHVELPPIELPSTDITPEMAPEMMENF